MTNLTLSNTHGFTLIEVLIALLILTIGLLGMAGLQTRGIQQSQNSYLQTQAAVLVNDMADRIRSNPAGRASYNGFNSKNAQPTQPDCGATGSICSALDTATNDKYLWADPAQAGSIANLLPSGFGTVAINNEVITVSVFWRNPLTPATVNGTGCSGNPAVDLPCYSVQFAP
jgi:type IV pilus assembly protein PilV